MTITFVTNLVNHHQIPLADEFYKILGTNYCYIATLPLPDWLIKGGYDPTLDRPYIIRAYEGEEEMIKARDIINVSDVVIIGSAPIEWVYKRKLENKITFHYNERWLKKNLLMAFNPKVLYNIFKNHFQFRNKRTYMLCASAYAASDAHFYHCYPNKTFKWGYITQVDYNYYKTYFTPFNSDSVVKIMWCARFLKWKHPELTIKLAKRLKDKGYKFHITMYGTGILFDEIVNLSNKYKVNDVITFYGNVPNEQVILAMRQHDIFLFTSDRNEGWGAVANEAMANGCVLIGSEDIGSVPFLIKNKVNGLIFKSKNISSLTEKVEWALNHPEECQQISRNAIKTMQNLWSPVNAAKSFLQLVDDIQNNRPVSIKNGPCSIAK